jgi:hypothetical protein
LAAVDVEVVAAVCVDPLGSLPGSATDAPDPGDLVDQGHELGDVMAVAADQGRGEGMPPASVMTWCFEPERRRSTGLGPVLGRL